MPLTRLANSVIDGVTGREAEVIDDILGYAGSDLVCYRAEGPDGLVALQERIGSRSWPGRNRTSARRSARRRCHARGASAVIARDDQAAAGPSRCLGPCRAPRHDRAYRLGAASACRGAWAGSHRKRRGPRRMSMRISRSANGARTKRRSGGGCVAGATSRRLPACSISSVTGHDDPLHEAVLEPNPHCLRLDAHCRLRHDRCHHRRARNTQLVPSSRSTRRRRLPKSTRSAGRRAPRRSFSTRSSCAPPPCRPKTRRGDARWATTARTDPEANGPGPAGRLPAQDRLGECRRRLQIV